MSSKRMKEKMAHRLDMSESLQRLRAEHRALVERIRVTEMQVGEANLIPEVSHNTKGTMREI